MIRAILRIKDGLPSGRPWLSSVVETIQEALVHAGESLTPDGQFGGGTVRAVKSFQTNNGFDPTGIVDKSMWRRLAPNIAATAGERDQRHQTLLDKFDGDLGWIHALEGHNGRPYWPGGQSGITLDPGVDLGHVPVELFRSLYQPILSAAQVRTLQRFIGLKRENARDALKNEPALREIRVSRKQAFEIMPYAAQSYWNGVCSRFPATRRQTTPPSVKTVMLSLAYNRGIYNRRLEPLGPLLDNRSWNEVGETIGKMQQNHELKGIRRRRRAEAALVTSELEFLK